MPMSGLLSLSMPSMAPVAALFRYYTLPEKEPRWWDEEGILPGLDPEEVTKDKPEALFTEGQRQKFGIDAYGEVLDEARHWAAIERVRKLRLNTFCETVELDGLPRWLRQRGASTENTVFLKGFDKGIANCYDGDVLSVLGTEACRLLVFDGSDYDVTGFTSVVVKFLRAQPSAKVLAFKLSYELDDFQESWRRYLKEFEGRISVVPLELRDPSWIDANRFGLEGEASRLQAFPSSAIASFYLTRIAVEATRSKLVVSLGGGSTSKHEARAHLDAGRDRRLILFVLSRIRQPRFKSYRGPNVEKHPTLCDWAVHNEAKYRTNGNDGILTVVRGKDPNEAGAFSMDMSATQLRPRCNRRGGAGQRGGCWGRLLGRICGAPPLERPASRSRRPSQTSVSWSADTERPSAAERHRVLLSRARTAPS